MRGGGDHDGKGRTDGHGGGADGETGISDSWVTAKTKLDLFADERVKGRQISVETVKGAVTLRGKVDSNEAKAAAASIAQAVDGAKSVRNDLQVVPPGDRPVVDASDKEITRQVEGRLSKDMQLKKVDVRTDGGRSSSPGPYRALGPVPGPPSSPVTWPAPALSRTS